jgi:hypothetical protein
MYSVSVFTNGPISNLIKDRISSIRLWKMRNLMQPLVKKRIPIKISNMIDIDYIILFLLFR